MQASSTPRRPRLVQQNRRLSGATHRASRPAWSRPLATCASAFALIVACGAQSESGGGGDGTLNGGQAGLNDGFGGGEALSGADGDGQSMSRGGEGGAAAGSGANGAGAPGGNDEGGANAEAGGGGQSEELAICGDGVIAGDEACDDGAQVLGDGCSAHCRLEVGFGCREQPSICERTDCGNGVQEGAETCDDGNRVPFDGCGVTCQLEPRCSSAGCTSACGDGLVIDEECDDGNTKSGDGCSATCQTEPGFVCSPQASCEKINGECVLRVPAIYRDFTVAHPDFGAICRGQGGGAEATEGLVEDALRGGVPVAKASVPYSACVTQLSDWYSDTGSQAIVRELVLFDNGKGAFVNRFGSAGQRWQNRPLYQVRWCGNGDSGCTTGDGFTGCDFDPAIDTCFYPCPLSGVEQDTCAGTATAQIAYDGTPLFFPLDDQPVRETWASAKVPPAYGYDWLFEDTVVPVYGKPHVADRALHNFYFTSQITSWLKYDPAANQLDFLGDDDLWVFVNGQLALDLGGVHYAVAGSLALDTAATAHLGLEPGRVYRIDVFHAERKLESSSLRVTLPGFELSRSECYRLSSMMPAGR